MRSKRSIRKRGVRNRVKDMEVDITSLLDILVILLVFLIKSYNASGVIINIPEGITIPNTTSISLNTSGVNVQVSETKIWVDDKLVSDSENPELMPVERAGIIVPLYNELKEKRELVQVVEKASPEAKKFSGIVNLVFDKSIPYSKMKKIMHTSGRANYSSFKFVLLGLEQ